MLIQRPPDNVDLPLKTQVLTLNPEPDDDVSTEADSTLYTDLKDAEKALIELEGSTTPVAELDTSRPVAELPAHSKVHELEDVDSTRTRHELEGSSGIFKR